jgi:hypothetical protein
VLKIKVVAGAVFASVHSRELVKTALVSVDLRRVSQDLKKVRRVCVRREAGEKRRTKHGKR